MRRARRRETFSDAFTWHVDVCASAVRAGWMDGVRVGSGQKGPWLIEIRYRAK